MRVEERQIDGLTVRSVRLAATEGSRLAARLGRLFADSFGVVAAALAQAAPDLGEASGSSVLASLGRLDIDALAPAIGKLFGQLDDAEHDRLLLATLRGTEIVRDGRKHDLLTIAKIDIAFDGFPPQTLWRVWWFALQANFALFSTGGSATPSARSGGNGEPPREA
jgi:hypothetical protein